jgi:ribosomal protein S30
MKTINLKNAFKLFFFSLILCGANAFSFTQLPTAASSSGYGSRTSCSVTKATKVSKTTPKAYSKTSKSFAMQSKSKKFFKK